MDAAVGVALYKNRLRRAQSLPLLVGQFPLNALVETWLGKRGIYITLRGSDESPGQAEERIGFRRCLGSYG